MRKLQVIDCLSNNEFFELLDKECLVLKLVIVTDPLDQHRYELVSPHFQEDAQRRFAIMYANKLHPSTQGRDEVQSISRARVAKSDAHSPCRSVQRKATASRTKVSANSTGTLKGNCMVKGTKEE